MASKRKILIVEDEADQIKMLTTRLEASGFEAITAMTGEEGIEKALENKPDLILLDVILPHANGYDVCKRLKANPITKNIPIIIITASGAKDIEEKCLACGAYECIKKPYESKVLVAKIKTLLGVA